ncbi:MAG: hypothetical protein ACRELD_09205, partial [Longimicrobiales bacterium]
PAAALLAAVVASGALACDDEGGGLVGGIEPCRVVVDVTPETLLVPLQQSRTLRASPLATCGGVASFRWQTTDSTRIALEPADSLTLVTGLDLGTAIVTATVVPIDSVGALIGLDSAFITVELFAPTDTL